MPCLSIAWVIAWRTTLVRQRFVGVVEAERDLAVRRVGRDDVVGVVLELAEQLGVDAGDQVGVAVEQRVDGGVGIGEVLEHDLGDAAPASPQ